MRGPRTSTRARAAAPALMWIAVPPGEVEGAERVGDPAALRAGARVAVEGEDPVGRGEVAQDRPGGGEGAPGAEAHAVRDGARDEGDGDDREGRLEADVDECRDHVVGVGAELGVEQPAQTRVLDGVADQTVPGVAEGLREAEQHPCDADDAHRDDRHHHHVEDALGPDHASVEEGQGRRHEEDQRGAHEHPRGVTRVDLQNGHAPNSSGCPRRSGDVRVTAVLTIPPSRYGRVSDGPRSRAVGVDGPGPGQQCPASKPRAVK